MNKKSNSKPKNLIGKKLLALRTARNLSQRDFAAKLQLMGYDIDRNVITRIETDKRRVTDKELKAFCEIFQVSAEELMSSDSDSTMPDSP